MFVCVYKKNPIGVEKVKKVENKTCVKYSLIKKEWCRKISTVPLETKIKDCDHNSIGWFSRVIVCKFWGCK